MIDEDDGRGLVTRKQFLAVPLCRLRRWAWTAYWLDWDIDLNYRCHLAKRQTTTYTSTLLPSHSSRQAGSRLPVSPKHCDTAAATVTGVMQLLLSWLLTAQIMITNGSSKCYQDAKRSIREDFSSCCCMLCLATGTVCGVLH